MALVLSRARAYNKKTVKKAPPLWPSDPGSSNFALVAARFQERAGLAIDGMFGPNTQKALAQARADVKPSSYLIIADRRVEVDFPVVTWEQDPWWSLYPKANFRWRTSPVQLFILHWDVARSSRSCKQILEKKKVSVHLMTDADGVTYQSLDLAHVRAHHAGSHGDANDRSVGNEICNPYYLKYEPQTTRALITDAPVNGNRAEAHLDFHEVQKENVVKLAEALHTHMDIPHCLPTNPEWDSHWKGDDQDPDGSVVRGMLDARGLAHYHGVAGHYHYEEEKMDPGTSLFAYFQKKGW